MVNALLYVPYGIFDLQQNVSMVRSMSSCSIQTYEYIFISIGGL